MIKDIKQNCFMYLINISVLQQRIIVILRKMSYFLILHLPPSYDSKILVAAVTMLALMSSFRHVILCSKLILNCTTRLITCICTTFINSTIQKQVAHNNLKYSRALFDWDKMFWIIVVYIVGIDIHITKVINILRLVVFKAYKR